MISLCDYYYIKNWKVPIYSHSTKIKIMKKYAMIQIDADVHQLLKEFCKEKGYKISGLVETLIKDKVSSIKKPLPKNVLTAKN